MNFERISTYGTRTVRGTTVFGFNMGGVSTPSGWGMNGTENSYLNANSWHRPPAPVPSQARYIDIAGMFVGGAQEYGPFFFHVDVHDPDENPSVQSALDWTAVGGQGTFYYYYNFWNIRAPFWFRFPITDGKMLLRWKLDTGD